ncbi:acid ase [Fusarium beomiforme]|uniref:Acid ase n=1 Tax=Fusarium beomiforme TaxID=44412 RepID=A0A9P5AAU7_9HYPO|nr:acid ase [Fusarium beomiforme]
MRIFHLILVLLFVIICPVFTAVVGDGAEPAQWDISTSLNGFSFERAKGISTKTVDRTGVRISRLKSLKNQSGPQLRSALSYLARAHLEASRKGKVPYQNISAVGSISTAYAIECTWDHIPVWLIFDTGSSDTWAAKTGFTCEDQSGNVRKSQSPCNFGQPHIQGFLRDVSEVYFHRQYGSGEDVSGPMGLSEISCGGVTVSKQQVGLANRAYWRGDNVTVGLLGLAYPSLTSAYIGDPNDISDESEWDNYPYSPWFTTAVSKGLVDPVFSVSIDRNTSDGILVWGGLPPMPWGPKSVAATDLIIAKIVDQEKTGWEPSFYTIIPDGLQWGSTTDTGKYPYIVDTGTTMMHMPPPLAEAIAKAFQPPATWMFEWSAYFADCNAIPPHFAVIISGVRFWLNPADLIFQDFTEPVTGKCAIAISTGGSGPYILGELFLQNVVAVFDVGGAEMRFYSK